MKKGYEKPLEMKGVTKSSSQIKFIFNDHSLECFKGKEKHQLNKSKADCAKDIKWLSQFKPTDFSKLPKLIQPVQRNRTISCARTFNEQVVIMQYHNIDVYIDNSTRKKSNSSDSKSSDPNGKKSDQEDGPHDQFIEKCVRDLTQQTDNTSNPLSLSTYRMSHTQSTPRSLQLAYDFDMYNMYEGRGKPMRNKQSVSMQQSKRFIIEFNTIQSDGRTTVMVKNIPNKYTQQMLLQQFTVNYENKFDFFYLPIDKDNDCNVGYAFVNFITTAYLKQFYEQFHEKKWKKYKSPKICNICYARYQGTLQLADHFKHTKIMNQRDRRVRPLIGINEANTNKIKDIKEIIKNQRSHE